MSSGVQTTWATAQHPIPASGHSGDVVFGQQFPIQTSGGGPATGLLLSPASEVIPQKLVDRIRAGRFVDMRDMLQDNIALIDQLEVFQGQAVPLGPTRPRMREITSLQTWCHCFLGYIAAMTSDPITRDQLAYARIIIREAQRQGGLSFLDYDKAFRQQLAADPSIPWNVVNPSLLASTMFGQRSSTPGTFCSLCRAVDHTRQQCALAYLEPSPPAAPPQRLPPQPPRRPRPIPICFAWNKGSCPYATRCNYRHICSSCMTAGHRSSNCPQSPPATSVSSRPGPTPPRSS